MTENDGATTPGAAPSGAAGHPAADDPSVGAHDGGRAYEGRHHRNPADVPPSPAQAAAAKAAYQDVQTSTGGVKNPQTADPIEDEDGERVTVDESGEPITADDLPESADPVEGPASASGGPLGAAENPGDGVDGDADRLAAERLADLQRLQAEYVNYKRRVDRDRAVESERAIASMVEALLPVLDEIQLAREHGELDGPFAKIAEKLETTLSRYGVERYGQPGETFDPVVHEAVMHSHAELAPGTTETTVVQILQPGYKIGDKVLRAALVAVADPL